MLVAEDPRAGISRHAVAAIAVLLAALAFSPVIFLRYEFFDSWSLLYVVNATRVYNFTIGCLESYEIAYLVGRPLQTVAVCLATIFGPVTELMWIWKLLSLAAWGASGAIVAAELRRAGASVAVAVGAVLSILFLPGTLLIISELAAVAISFGLLPAAVAGYVWLRLWRGPGQSPRARAGAIASILALLVVSMASYQIVALMFFVPVLAVLLFAPMSDHRRPLRLALGTIAVFGAASILYLGVHFWLLYGHHYFFLKPEWVAGISSTSRSATLHFGFGHIAQKLRYLGDLLPDIATMWFVSEWRRVSVPAAAIVAAALAAAGVALVFRRGGGWRFAAVAVVCSALFVPYLASDNAGNLYYSQQRILVFFQMPVAIILWWLIHLLVERRRAWVGPAAAASAAVIFAGTIVSYLVIMRAHVIPNYMELKHIEYRVRDAVRHDIKHIYIIRSDPAHLRAVLGAVVNQEFASVTSNFVPLHMVAAILTEIEGKRPTRSIIPVPADQAERATPAPDRLILDMRHFP